MTAGSWWGAPARLVAAAVVALLIAAEAALAAVEPPLLLAQADTATVSSVPDSYSATYGDWQLNCVRNAADPAASAVTCQAVITVFAEGQQQPFAQIAFSKAPDGATHLTLLAPVNILARQQPMVGTDAADPGIEVPWLTCQPQGCVADLLVAEADLERFRTATGQGRLVFSDSVGNAITISFSFRGLTQALDALAAELAK